MALEKECDFFLVRIYDMQTHTVMPTITRDDLKSIPEIRNGDFKLLASINEVIPILITDGFVQQIRYEEYKVTDKGIAFLSSDSYTERRKRWVIENYTKKFQYKMRYASYILSLTAIGLSIFAILRPPKHTQILLLPKQELKLPNSTLDTLHMLDSLPKTESRL